MAYLNEIFSKMNGLTPRQKTIAEFVMARPEEAAFYSLKDLSEKSGTSEVSVLRMCRGLGFENYVQFKDALRENTMLSLKGRAPLRLFEDARGKEPGDPLHTLGIICAEDIDNVRGTVEAIDGEKLLRCAEGLLSAREVVLFSHDASSMMADYLAYRLNFLRVKAVSIKLGEYGSVQSALARISDRDYAVLFSFAPYYKPIGGVADFCRRIGIPIITITSGTDSPAAVEWADSFICSTKASFFYNSHASTMAFINILTSCMAAEMGELFQEILDQERDVSNYISSSGDF